MSERTMTNKAAMAFLNDMAVYFERRPTGGEDSAHWSNVMNAENCRIVATMIHRLDLIASVASPTPSNTTQARRDEC